jgi:hypothetical protein
MLLYQPLYIYGVLVLLITYNIFYNNQLLIELKNYNNLYYFIIHYLLNCYKTYFMNKQMAYFYANNKNNIFEYEQTEFFIYQIFKNLLVSILAIYVCIDNIFIYYSNFNIINNIPFFCKILLNIIKFYNVYEIYLYCNFIKYLHQLLYGIIDIDYNTDNEDE